MILGLFDDMTRHRRNLFHENITLELTLLDLAQFEFPVAGQLGRNQLWNFEPRNSVTSENALAVGCNSLPERST